jgi:hypothetical protein
LRCPTCFAQTREGISLFVRSEAGGTRPDGVALIGGVGGPHFLLGHHFQTAHWWPRATARHRVRFRKSEARAIRRLSAAALRRYWRMGRQKRRPAPPQERQASQLQNRRAAKLDNCHGPQWLERERTWARYASGSKSSHLSRASGFQARHFVERPSKALGMVARSEPFRVIPRIRFHVLSLDDFSFSS